MKGTIAVVFASTLLGAGPVGPVAGWTLDSRTASLRAVTGIPGALRLANALQLPFGVAAAEFTISGDAAVILTTDQPARLAVLGALRSPSITVTDLGEVADQTRILALNAKGNTAIFYAPEQQELRFLNNVDGAAAISEPVSTASLAGPITAAVLDDAGQCAVLGTDSVETLCANGSSRHVVPDTGLRVVGLALVNGNLWFADAASKTVQRVANYATQSTATVFASVNDGLSHPVALAVTPSGQVIVADADAPAIFAIDPVAQTVQAVALDLQPTQLRGLTDRSLLLINDLSALPFTLFATEAMRTYFVPAN